MKTHLFLFTLGPVQSFIAQARKAHDLHSGSRLLSDLCRFAALEFEKQDGEIIFPIIEKDLELAKKSSNPNRFLGKITTEKDLSEIGKSIEDAVRAAWKVKFAPLEKMLDGSAKVEAKRQIEQHLDIQWLFEPVNGDYKKAYDEINQNLNALKNSRPFATPNETGRKCSLDGERNVIFYRLGQNQVVRQSDNAPLYSVDNRIFNYDDKDSILKLRHLQPGEGLSAVSMLKRFQDFNYGDFASTAEFALSDTMFAIRQTKDGERAFQDMVEHFKVKENELNWQVFFEENLNVDYFKKQGLKGEPEEAKKILAKIVSIAKGLDKSRKLEKYYAIVVFDGDHMGEWWKGDRLKDGETLEEFHLELTARLAEFAQQVRAEYSKDNHRGWVIYAGGDDFLGFFNLHHLVDAINFLRKTYQTVVQARLASRIKEGFTLTFSAGVCVAHYKEPLSLVLGQARELEKDAKNLDEAEKNAVGIGVIPGSGQTAEVVLPFKHFAHLGTIISNLQTSDFSNAFVSKARTELAAFTGKDGKLLDELLDTAKSLLDRAVSRACNLTKKEGESEEDFKKRKSEKVVPLQNAVKALLEINSKNLSAFFDALDIADFIERQTHISITKTEQPTHETTT